MARRALAASSAPGAPGSSPSLSSRGGGGGGGGSVSNSRGLGSRVDTDEDLMQKPVAWEIDRGELDWAGSVKLGAGAFGEVVRGKWRGTPVAVKKVNVAAGGAGAIAELRHEIAVMSHMHHPRVVQFLGACTRQQPWLLLSEFMKGGSVAQALAAREGRPLPPRMAGRWALDMAQALRYLHEHKPRGVVHRDLKPQNLLVDGSWHVKISDFGLAKVVDQLKALDERYKLTGETGSYRYMAPEVFRHESYNAKVDIYAFSMICYYFAHGEPPFARVPPVDAARAAAVEHLRPEIRASVDRDFAALIRQCWDRDPAARPSAAQLCVQLEKLFPDEDPATAAAAAAAAAGAGAASAGAATAEVGCGACAVA